MLRCTATNRLGFTLIELLVVISIIGILIAILLPGLREARRTAQLATCMANVRSMGIAMTMYAADHRDVIAKSDFGRSDTASNRYLGDGSNIAFGRGPADGPQEKRTILHGTWLMDAYLSTASIYFCPGRTMLRELTNGWAGSNQMTLAEREEAFTGAWAPIFRSGGNTVLNNHKYMGQNMANLNTHTVTYRFNGILLRQDHTQGNHLLMRGSAATHQGYRLFEMNSTFPVLSDVSVLSYGPTENSGRHTTHQRRGYNVLAADGSVRFLSISALVDAAATLPTTAAPSIAGHILRWLPEDPSADSEFGITASGQFNSTWYAHNSNSHQLWNAMHGALK